MNRLIVPVLTALLLPSLAGAADAKTHVGDLTSGSRLFSVHCSACHGADGRGSGPVKAEPASASLTSPSTMTLMSDGQLFALLKKGGPALGKAASMPAFGSALSDLEIWDLVAYLRSRHLSLTDFYPEAESFFGDRYSLDKWGRERHLELTRAKVPTDSQFTVLGVYKGTQGPEGPRLIPNDPLALSKIDRRAKIGYVAFVEAAVPGVKGKHLLGISMDNGGLVWKVLANTEDAAAKKKIESTLAVWEGYGHKGQKSAFDPMGRSKKDKELARVWTEIYSRAMEAVVMYDKAERERHWADADFGGPADPEASVEGGVLEVDQGNKKKRKKR